MPRDLVDSSVQTTSEPAVPVAVTSSTGVKAIRRTLAAFRYRDFRILWFGSCTSSKFNLARVIGPLLAGGALAMFGMTSCFSLNGLSFLVVIAALMSLHVKHTPPAAPRRIHEELRGGLSYVRRQTSLLALTVLAFATTFLAFAILTFLPLFAKQVFHQDVGEYTRLMAFSGSGSVVGAMAVAWLGKY